MTVNCSHQARKISEEGVPTNPSMEAKCKLKTSCFVLKGCFDEENTCGRECCYCCWNDQEKSACRLGFYNCQDNPFIHTPCYLDS